MATCCCQKENPVVDRRKTIAARAYTQGEEMEKKPPRKSVKEFLIIGILFVAEVVLMGLIRLVLGNIGDYFSNLKNQFKIKQEIRKRKGSEYLSCLMGDKPQVHIDTDDELVNNLKELQEKRFDITNAIIAIIISAVGLIISLKLSR
jgi:hypothetical protein